MRTIIWFQSSGKNYKPSAVGFEFAKQHDSGALKTCGKGAGLPYDYGYSEVEVSDDWACGERLSELIRIIEPLLPKIRESGADSLAICVFSFGSGSSRIDISAEQIVRLASLRCDFICTYSPDDHAA